jgi:hypothetical protein
VSKFHSILCLVAQKSRLGRKGSVLSMKCSRQISPNCSWRTNPGLGRTSTGWYFKLNLRRLFWPYLAFQVSNVSHSFFTAFVTSRGSFVRCWLVCSSPYCRVLLLGFQLGT